MGTAPSVAIVGGGPAGAALAIRLAQLGRDVAILERSSRWHWRACGVFTSPATVNALRRVGLTGADLAGVARPIPAMRVETVRGTRFRLTYGDDDSLASPAVGLDRSRLDPMLLERARAAGASVREGSTVREAALDETPARLELADGSVVRANVVVGADGLRSVVSRAAGVDRPARLGSRTGLTFHVSEPPAAGDRPRDARMILFDDGYVGLAPVPGGRVNVGIVVGGRWRSRLHQEGASAVVAAVLRAIPRPAEGDDPVDWGAVATAPEAICDAIEGAAPVGHRAARRSGANWLLVGDAAGFLDPFTGEGLHRALVSAELAATAIDRHLAGVAGAMAAYDRSMRSRFGSKDVVSLLVQGFLAQPRLFEHAARRLAARTGVRETMALVMGDLVPATRALDPRFVAALLRP
jgi:flavin-dependent dehydrogenase